MEVGDEPQDRGAVRFFGKEFGDALGFSDRVQFGLVTGRQDHRGDTDGVDPAEVVLVVQQDSGDRNEEHAQSHEQTEELEVAKTEDVDFAPVLHGDALD